MDKAIFRLGILTGLALLATPLRAQTLAQADISGLSLEQLGDVEITTVSKRPQLLSKAPAAVYVITAEDIRRSGAINLPEALRLAPNLEVARMNGFAYTITARGFNSPESSNKLLVLIDGRSVYSPLASSVFWENLDVPLSNIARIEVVSGPGGTLYGANAVNGVINIVTRSAKETQGATVRVDAGTTDGKATGGYGFSPWEGGAMRIYAMGSHANDTTRVSALDPTRTAWTRLQGGFRFDQDYQGDSMTLQGDIFNNTTPAMAIEKGRGYNLNGRWSHPFEGGSSLDLQLYTDENSRILPGLAREQLNTYDIQAQHNTALWWNDAFIWGAEYRHSKESFYSYTIIGFANPTTDVNIENLFVQDEFRLLDDLKITTGMKIENSSYSNVDFMPDLRLAWQVSDTDLIWGAISRAVRTPSKVDRELQLPGFIDPAPRFHSEKLTSYEVGYRGQPLTQLSLSLTLYYDYYDDIRTDHATPVTVFPIQLRNGITGDNYGAEFWGKYGLTDWWRLSFGATWLQRTLHMKPGRDDISFGQAIGQDPPYQAQLRSEMNLPNNFEFDAGLRAIGHVKQRDPMTGNTKVLAGSYVEADLRLGWHVTPATEISLAGFNLIHQNHLEAYDPSTYLPQYVPRSFVLSLRQSF